MFSKDHFLFSIATIFLFLVVFLFTTGLFSVPMDEPGMSLENAMKDYKISMGMGMSPSIFDVQMSQGWTMSLLMVFMGVLNFLFVARGSFETLSLLALAEAFCMWALVLIYAYYSIPPSLVSFLVLGVLFSLSAFRYRSRKIPEMIQEIKS